jgi:sulfatase-modifying factor enzyme 1
MAEARSRDNGLNSCQQCFNSVNLLCHVGSFPISASQSMKLLAHLILGCLVLASSVHAAVTQMKEFDDLMRQYGNDVQLSAGAIYQAGVGDLKQKYAAAVDRALNAAQEAGRLEDALACKTEAKLIADGGDLSVEDVNLRPEVQKLRAIYRQSLARLEQEKSAATNPIISALVVSLDRLIITLTKAGRLEEAVFVKQKKESLGKEIATATATAAAVADVPRKGDFTNILGMKFAPVPDMAVQFCIHETRRQDYAAYAAGVSGVDASWKNQVYKSIPCGDKDNHPVVGVSRDEAQKFCAWLSKKEGKIYRLPTDEEWSHAVGIGQMEKREKGTTPAMVIKLPNEFPWGGSFPPQMKDQAGNYSDGSRKAKAPTEGTAYLENYDDGSSTTAAVMSYKPNKLGLYDLGGNAWEWCEDWYDNAQKDGVLRGGSWYNGERAFLLSSYRNHRIPTARDRSYGFRIVLVVQ